ncbi:WASH complex subunit 2 [Anastrepha ludens]|uniref:WASH complex subunit 2 n=1 Tax=Anastrepha ludens TaxID=28586 RepID=UPI0023B01B80|nr:WASH complex subunit 2 [Anastrepha ludens]
MEEGSRAEKIISQAVQWSFEGDCSLLTWMQELSQNLEQRASTTSDALQQLSVNVNRTAIALENAANSLTALQYTQFVESRCHDDDETLANATELPAEVVPTSSDKTTTPSELLGTFLRKNLQMLHNSHEKYALDFEDSDDDESTTATNCIYQPKNPYNDALLPHIYGSKLWKEHWHVGLCDGSNEYSGDETSDAFSESSSSSATDNESYESNTANLSEWASSTSIPIEHKHPALLVITQNNPAVTATNNAAAQNKRLPTTPHFPSNDDSDTCSTTSRSTTRNPATHQARVHDLFATLRHDTPITSTSASSSSPQQQQIAVNSVHTNRNAAEPSSILPPFIDSIPPTDIFADAVLAQKTNSNTERESIQPRSETSQQSKRMPVNLFDDDDFNSFMTEVEDKPQTKAEQHAQLPVPATRNLSMKNEASVPPVKQATVPNTVDLFAEQLNIKTPIVNQSTVPAKVEKPNEIKQRKPINLFDSPEDSSENDSIFSTTIPSKEKKLDIGVAAAKPTITAKLLFDDDEDDDDFLNVFGTKKLNLPPPKSTGKSLFFDEESDKDSRPTKQSSRFTSNLFDDIPPADYEPQSTLKHETKKVVDSRAIEESGSRASIQKDATATAQVDLFDNIDDGVGQKPILDFAKTGVQPQRLETAAVKSGNKLFGGNLFGDEDTEDLDDLLSTQSKASQQLTKSVPNEAVRNLSNSVEATKAFTKEITHQKRPLFKNVFVDNDDLFSERVAKRDAQAEDDDTKAIPNKTSQIPDAPSRDVPKRTALFDDDFDDDSDDLFGVKATTKVILNQQNSTDNRKQKDGATLLEQKQNKKSPTKQATETANVNPPTALLEDVLETGKEDLFNEVNIDSVSEVTKEEHADMSEANSDTMQSNSTVPSVVDQPVSTLFEKKTAATPINELQSSALFVDDNNTVSESLFPESLSSPNDDINEQVVNYAEKNPIVEANSLAVTAEKAADNEILKSKMQEADDSSAAVAQTSSTSKSSHMEIAVEPDENSSNVNATETSLEPSMPSVVAPADIDTQSVHNHKYSGIFLDEPPDDDDFFTTLNNSTQPLSVSKLTLDLENDFYEPALPETPSIENKATAITGTNVQKNGNIKNQPNSSSDYGGLRLFSEIPPDDDGDDFSFSAPAKATPQNTVMNQRLHSIFYDDFSETLEAVQQIKENRTAAQMLFADEPPADEELFNIMEKVTPTKPHAKKREKAENLIDSTSQMPSVKKESFKVERDWNDELATSSSNVAASSKDVTDRVVNKLNSDFLHAPEKSSSPPGKLQMPNIKINVQALLPGVGGKPNFKKSPTSAEVSKPSATPTEIPEPSTTISKDTSSASLISTTTSESANENMLTSVCKTRIRAPAGRRPSTRRARQENYRQSLIGEQADLERHDDALKNQPEGNVPDRDQHQEQLRNKAETTYVTIDSSNEGATALNTSSGGISALHTNLFVDDDGDDAYDYDSLFKSAHIRNAEKNIPTQSANLKTPNSINDHRTAEKPFDQTPTVQATAKNPSTFTKYFAEKEDDNADDLFESAHVTQADSSTSTIIKTKTNKPTTAKSTSKSVFGTPPSEDGYDDLFNSGKSAPPVNATTTQTTKYLPPTIKATNVSGQQKQTASIGGSKLDSIFGSDDEDADFLSNLKPKKKTTTASLKSTSSGSIAKQATAGGGGLFSDIESDEDDLFGGKSKSKHDTVKTKATTATKMQVPPTHKSTKITSTLKNPATLTDNPLADLLDP